MSASFGSLDGSPALYGMLAYWIAERESIYTRKEIGKPKPWTKDTILQSYSFCNVYRENDRVTKWIHENFLAPHYAGEDVWFAMVAARLINWPDSLEELGYPVPWHPKEFIATLQRRKKAGLKVFSGAYIVSTNGHAMDKLEYLAGHVLSPMWADRETIRPKRGEHLLDIHQRLMQYDGMGSFMAAQVIADIKWSSTCRNAPDWATFAAPGPGSLRGMNRLYGLEPDAPSRKDDWLLKMRELQAKLNEDKRLKLPRPLDAQNIQNCLCEFDKYMRTLNGEGRPRATYNGRK